MVCAKQNQVPNKIRLYINEASCLTTLSPIEHKHARQHHSKQHVTRRAVSPIKLHFQCCSPLYLQKMEAEHLLRALLLGHLQLLLAW
jgi:hypothetical protein